MTGWQWVSVLRTNALGVVVCCLSSLSGEVRTSATKLLARIYADVQVSTVIRCICEPI